MGTPGCLGQRRRADRYQREGSLSLVSQRLNPIPRSRAVPKRDTLLIKAGIGKLVRGYQVGRAALDGGGVLVGWELLYHRGMLGLDFRISGSGSRVQGSEVRVEGLIQVFQVPYLLQSEPSLDALNLLSDVISSMKVHSLSRAPGWAGGLG